MAVNALTVDLPEARDAFVTSVDAFVAAARGLGEYDLLGRSRCHGWTRLDVVTHVIAGWQEMLCGFATPDDGPPTVDAASYWPAYAEEFGDDDPVDVLMSQRRRGDAWPRPSSAVGQLRELAAAMRSAAHHLPDQPCRWQGHVFSAGDFLAVWAVEDVVHQLDLDVDGEVPRGALSLTRATVEALVGEPLPTSWSDQEAVLVGAGRIPVPASAAPLADRLPVI